MESLTNIFSIVFGKKNGEKRRKTQKNAEKWRKMQKNAEKCRKTQKSIKRKIP
jgi:hypothetical protein